MFLFSSCNLSLFFCSGCGMTLIAFFSPFFVCYFFLTISSFSLFWRMSGCVAVIFLLLVLSERHQKSWETVQTFL